MLNFLRYKKRIAQQDATIAQLRAEIAELKRRQEPPTSDVEHIYIDSFGNNWFTFKNFELIPAARRTQYIIATAALELNLTADEMTKYLDAINQLVFNIEKDTQEKKAKIIAINERIRERTQLAIYYKVLGDLANIFFCIEGEPTDQVLQEWFNKKNNILANDSKAKEFFFVLLTRRIYNYNDISPHELLEYLSEQVHNRSLDLQDLT